MQGRSVSVLVKPFLVTGNKEYPNREIREDDIKICGKVVWILNKS